MRLISIWCAFWIGSLSLAAGAQERADLTILNRCPFPIEATYQQSYSPFRKVSLGILRAHQRKLYRGALPVGRTELTISIAADVSNNFIKKGVYVNNPGDGKRPRPATLELTAAHFGNPVIPKPPRPTPPAQHDEDDPTSFSGAWYSVGRGVLSLSQSGLTVSGSLSGLGSEHWAKGQRNGGTVTKGKVDPETDTATLDVKWGDNTTSVLTMTLSQGGKAFTGRWTWKGAEGPWDGVRGKRP